MCVPSPPCGVRPNRHYRHSRRSFLAFFLPLIEAVSCNPTRFHPSGYANEYSDCGLLSSAARCPRLFHAYFTSLPTHMHPRGASCHSFLYGERKIPCNHSSRTSAPAYSTPHTHACMRNKRKHKHAPIPLQTKIHLLHSLQGIALQSSSQSTLRTLPGLQGATCMRSLLYTCLAIVSGTQQGVQVDLHSHWQWRSHTDRLLPRTHHRHALRRTFCLGH